MVNKAGNGIEEEEREYDLTGYEDDDEEEYDEENDAYLDALDEDDEEDDDYLDEPSNNIQQDVPSSVSVSNLDSLLPKMQELMREKGWSITELKQELYNVEFREVLKEGNYKLDDVLLGITPKDTAYLELFGVLYPEMKGLLEKYAQPNLNEVHYRGLDVAINNLMGRLSPSNKPEEEVEHPEQEESYAIEEEMEVDPTTVENVVEAILKVYDSLYAPCFLSRPKGIITSSGLLTFSEKKQAPVINKFGQIYLKELYKTIDASLPGGGYLGNNLETTSISSEYFDEDGNLTKTYSPVYHLFNVMGLKRLKDKTYQQVLEWSTFRNYLRKDIEYKVTNVLEHFIDRDTLHIQRNLISLFTNCVILVDFNITRSFELRYSIDGVSNQLGNIIKQQEKAIFAKDFGEVISNEKNEFNVHNLLYVFDKDAYTSEILFSYKAYENLIRSGNKPDIKNVIVGKLLNGQDYKINLDDNTIKAIGIQAGSRSGKGVLTLNLMANILANGNPLIYLDYKPDMASVIWDMERYVNEQTGSNIRMLSVDGLSGKTKKSEPVRYYPFGMNANPELPLDSKDWALFPYLKALQLYALLIEQRHLGRYPKDKKFFVIMDEMQGFSKAYLPMISKLNSYAGQYIGGKKKEEPPASAVLAAKIAEVYGMALKTNLTQVRDVTGGTGKTAMILLGQKVNPDEWSVDVIENGKTVKKPWKESFAAQLLSATDLKLIGKNAGVGTSYGIGNLKTQGADLVDSDNTRGYWVSTPVAKPNDSTSTVFKSYLTLNDNDFNVEEFKQGNTQNMPYTGGVVGGIANPVDQDKVINEDLLDNGEVRKSIGLMGLMELITPDLNELAKNLSTGYEALYSLFSDMGMTTRYECIEEYLHDASDDSFYTYAELTDFLDRPLGSTPEGEGEEGEYGEGEDSLMGSDMENPAYDSPEDIAPKRRTGWMDEHGVFHEDESDGLEDSIEGLYGEQNGSYDTSDDNNLDNRPYQVDYEENRPVRSSTPDFQAVQVRDAEGNLVNQPVNPYVEEQQRRERLEEEYANQNPTLEGEGEQEEYEPSEDFQNARYNEKQFNQPQYSNPYNNPNIEPPNNVAGTVPQYDPTNIPFTARDLDTVQQALEYGVSPSPNNIEDTLPKYKQPIKLDYNPFKGINTSSGYQMAVHNMTEYLLKDIRKMVGSLENVETVEFTSSAMIINDIIYRPQFDKEFLEELPFQVKYQVEKGNVTELFNFKHLLKFPSLLVLRIDSIRLAEGRLRREMSIKPNKDWVELYHRMPRLKELYIAEQRIVTPEEVYHYKQSSKAGYDTQQRLAKELGVNPNIGNRSYGEEAWNTPVYRMMTGMLGSNIGTKAMNGVNGLVGAFNLFVGALRNTPQGEQQPNQQQSQPNNQNHNQHR